MPEAPADEPKRDGPERHPLRFLLLSLIALAALAFVVAHLPPRMKLIGLFPTVVGAVAGGLVAEIAARNGVRARRTVIATAATLAPLLFTEYAAETYRVWREGRADEIAAHLLAQPGGKAVLDRVLSDEPPANVTEAEFLAAYRDRMNPGPTEFLRRYPATRLGMEPEATGSLWPSAVWIAELLWGCAACVAAAAFLSRRPPATEASP